MELVSMLVALIFLTLYTVGALVASYRYEINTLRQRLIQKLLRLLSVRSDSINNNV